MATFCHSPYWDIDLTWFTEDPDLTPCFQSTVLVWIPLGFLLLSTASECLFCRPSASNTHQRKTLPLSILYITKLVFATLLLATSILQLILFLVLSDVPRAKICEAGTRTLTFALVIYELMKDRSQGRRSSGKLLIFWLLTTIASILQYRSQFLAAGNTEAYLMGRWSFILEMLTHTLVFASFLLSAFNEANPLIITKQLQEKDLNAMEEASFLSRIAFSWMDRVVINGFKRILSLSDFGSLSDNYKTENMWAFFWKYWRKEIGAKEASMGVGGKHPKNPSLARALLKAFWPYGFLGSLCELVYTFFRFMTPLLLNLILTHVSSNDPLWHGYLYAILLVASSLIAGVACQHMIFYMFSLGLQVKSALISAVYRKALKMSSKARTEFTVGELVNLMAVDAEKIYFLSSFINVTWAALLRIILSVIFLWQYLGPSCLVGVAVMLILMPITLTLAHFGNVVQEKQMTLKDRRIKFMNEILNGIKVLKLYAWEIPFMTEITKMRNKEVKLLRKFSYLNAGISVVWGITPYFIAVSSFVTFVLVDPKNVLDASTVFVSLTLFNMLRFYLVIVPDLVSNIVQTRVSFKRISDFLQCEELDSDVVGSNPSPGDAITVSNATFSWSKNEKPTVRRISLNVPKGSLVAVIGRVGSGKSSLLAALMGEMVKISGSLNLQGKIAYVAQQAWIQNATIKDNIRFLKPHDQRLYKKVLESCCLLPDLNILEGGDMTEIGEKGVNLSGGQKQRISLARAVYQNRDIYLLDDPLSAVDAHVGKDLFENVIGPHGMLKHKTRILVTNALSVLPEVDRVIVMDEGEIVEMGTYQELSEKKGVLKTLLEEHARNLSQESSDSTSVEVDYAKRPLGIDRLKSQLSMGYEENQGQGILKSRRSSSIKRLSNEAETVTLLIKEEKMELGKVKSTVYLNYIKYAGYLISILTVFFLTIFQVCEMGANVWLSMWSEDKPLPDGTQDLQLRDMRITVYAAFGLGEGISLIIGSLLLAKAAMHASRRLHFYMLHSVMRSPMSFFDTTPMGRILNRFGKDMDTVDTQLPMTMDSCIDCLLSVTGTFVIIAMSNPIFIAILLPISIFYYITQKLYISSCRQIIRMESIYRSPIYNNFSETISGVATIRAYDGQEFFILRNNNHVNVNQLCYVMSIGSNCWLALRLEFLGNIITFAVAMIAVATRGSMASGVVGLALTYAMNVTEALNWLVRMNTELESKSVSVERIHEYSKLVPEAPWELPGKTPKPNWPSRGQVQFRDYCTRYREGLDLVLHGIQLSILPQTKVGIVGRTGAGKSSLTLALFRIIEPARGTIIIDDIDITTLGLHDVRSRLTIIPQDPVLFTGSLRTNVDPNKAYEDPELWVALENAHLKQFVVGLTGGLDHPIAEGGQNLSVGQRQLVCLARALLRKTKVLILDEATAAVDLDTDRLIQNTIREKFKKCTIITIAHRLHTVLDYDRIVVMDQGKVIEEGTPTELLENPSSHFYGMAKDSGIV